MKTVRHIAGRMTIELWGSAEEDADGDSGDTEHAHNQIHTQHTNVTWRVDTHVHAHQLSESTTAHGAKIICKFEIHQAIGDEKKRERKKKRKKEKNKSKTKKKRKKANQIIGC